MRSDRGVYIHNTATAVAARTAAHLVRDARVEVAAAAAAAATATLPKPQAVLENGVQVRSIVRLCYKKNDRCGEEFVLAHTIC